MMGTDHQSKMTVEKRIIILLPLLSLLLTLGLLERDEFYSQYQSHLDAVDLQFSPPSTGASPTLILQEINLSSKEYQANDIDREGIVIDKATANNEEIPKEEKTTNQRTSLRAVVSESNDVEDNSNNVSPKNVDESDHDNNLPNLRVPTKGSNDSIDPIILQSNNKREIMFLPEYVDVKSQPHFNDFIGSPESTTVEVGSDCTCSLLSTDCLHTIRCLPEKNMEEGESTGIALRNFLRKHASFWRIPFDGLWGSPLGMSSQFTTMMVFREWLSKNQLPMGQRNTDEAFVNETMYSFCRENRLKGLNCFMEEFTKLEDNQDNEIKKSTGLKHLENQMLDLQDNPSHASAWIYLLAYCHISRITFNLRKHVLDIYTERLRVVDHSNGLKNPALPVALHIRRGDACRHSKDGYEKHASPLYSPPQMTSVRFCYDTEVYIEAIKRVQSESPNKHLVVYMATDDSSSLLEDIKTRFPQFYENVSWKYLEYSRDVFDYLPKNLDLPIEAYSIESPENTNKAVLGESALLDIHHLSHGQVFVGHLGSRFGKLGWYQAIARWNMFVPYFTVDGHSTCCDIDEACGTMSEYVVSMENCLAIFYEDVEQWKTNQTREDYWKPGIGKTIRKNAAIAEKKYREDHNFEISGIANVEWTSLDVPEATWGYYDQPEHPVVTRRSSPPKLFNSLEKCSKFMENLDTSPPQQLAPSQGACDAYQGILHIAHGDIGGASGTVFFQFMVGMLRWAEQHNYLPWVHFNDVSTKVYDKKIHSSGKPVKFEMLDGMKIGWARDSNDPLGYKFPGLPQKQRDSLEEKRFVFKGTGVWNHYFEPVSDFVPGDPSCRNKPLIRMEYDHILPGLHSHAPWSPHAWRYWMPNHIQLPDMEISKWFDQQRRHAAEPVKRYIQFNPYMEQRATCSHPKFEGSLGMHIRHGDKWPSRELLAVKQFLPFCQAYVDHGGTSIYLATDSAHVWDEIQNNWPSEVASLVQRQPSVQGLSSNQTAAFDLGVSTHRTNLEALTDIRALSKCKYLLHGWSAMTESVFYLNPSLIDRHVDLEDYEISQEQKLEHFQSILKQEQSTQS